MSLDLGTLMQGMTIPVSLGTTWLLSRKGYERWGYLVGLVTLPLWNVMEVYYGQWLYFALTPIYIFWWARGLKNHWGHKHASQEIL